MKKMILFALLIISVHLNATLYFVELYSKCGDEDPVRITLPIQQTQSAPPIDNGTLGNRFIGGGLGELEFTIGDCLTLCKGCKLLVKIGREEPLGYYDFIKDHEITNGAYHTVDGEIMGSLYVDPKTNINFISFDLNQMNTVSESDYIDIDGVPIFLPCVKIVNADNKDNIAIENRTICKGDCLKMNEIIGNLSNADGTDRADAVSYGCDPNSVMTPTPYPFPEKNLNEKIICFNQEGVFPICATVKDACGEKVITGVIEVKDCIDGKDCESCCNFLNSLTPEIISSWFTLGNLVLPTDFFACGVVDVYIYFSDGTSIVARGSGLVNLNGKSVTDICFIPAFGCNGCARCVRIGI